MNIELSNIINIFTIKDGKIYLIMNNSNLIKINCIDELEKANDSYIKKNLKINNINLKQSYVFSEKKDNNLYLNILFIDIVNYDSIKLSDNYNLVELSKLDINNGIIKESINYLRKELVLNSTIKKIYNNTFSLPEIQKLYEFLLNKKFDRRNFRKKLIKLNIIEDIDEFSLNNGGRPAKLYKFKEIKEDRVLF